MQVLHQQTTRNKCKGLNCELVFTSLILCKQPTLWVDFLHICYLRPSWELARCYSRDQSEDPSLAEKDEAAGAGVSLFTVTASAACTHSPCTLPSFTLPDTCLLAYCARQAQAACTAAITSIYSPQESYVSEVGSSMRPVWFFSPALNDVCIGRYLLFYNSTRRNTMSVIKRVM